MSRPKKNTVDYFPHSCVQRKTLFILKNKFNNDGYAFWFQLLEILGQSEDHYYDCRDSANIEYLVAYVEIEENVCFAILDLLASLGAIDPVLWGKKIVWCQKFIDGIADAYKRRLTDLPKAPTVIVHDNGLCKHKPTSSEVSDSINPQSILKESKEEKEKELKKIIERFLKLCKKEREEKKYISLFNFWNSKQIIQHRKLTDKIKGKIKSALKDFTEEEIQEAIDNYAIVVSEAETKYYWPENQKWTLAEFLQRGLERFLNTADPLTNFLNKNLKNQESPTSLLFCKNCHKSFPDNPQKKCTNPTCGAIWTPEQKRELAQ